MLQESSSDDDYDDHDDDTTSNVIQPTHMNLMVARGG